MTADFSEQLKAGVKAAENVKLAGRFKRVILCGMGGSALPGEIVTMLWLDDLNPYLQRGLTLPHWADENCLVVCTSWSGDTGETISSFASAIEKNLPLAVVTKGGQLAKLARDNNVPLALIPDENLPARFGVGYMLGALLTLIGRSAIIENSLNSLDFSTLSPNPATLAANIGQKTVLTYSSYQWRYLARYWKIHFNEDCKIHSFSNYFPEAAHNELAGFTQTNKGSYFPIILIDPDEEKADIQKLNKFGAFLTNQGFDHEIVSLDGKNRFQKIIKNINQAVSVSTELAKLLGVDPFDSSVIEAFKQS